MNAALRILTWLLALALVALPVVAVVNGWIGAERWPLSKLRVQGELARVQPAQLQAAVLPHARRGFFAVRLEDAKQAVRSMTYAMEVEVQHAALYQAALDNLGCNANKPLYVCGVCGETRLDLPEKCSVCNAADRAFEEIA